jgi:hypothetical protein
MVPSQYRLLEWSILLLSPQGHAVDAWYSRGRTPEDAFNNLAAEDLEELRKRKYRIEPFPERLHVQAQHKLIFEVVGLKGENGYQVEIHEYFAKVGFWYQLILETSANLESMAPVPLVKKLAKRASSVFGDLDLHPKALVIGIKEPLGIGRSGYAGQAIVGRNRLVYIELELTKSLAQGDYWEGLLYHEAMHAKYILEGRWPSMWPFYLKYSDTAPLWAFDCLQHFSIDGWLEKNNKKPFVYWSPTDEPDANLRSNRLSDLRELLQNSGCMAKESVLRQIADDLWGRETNIWEVWKIMRQLGLTIPEETPLGQYLKRGQI